MLQPQDFGYPETGDWEGPCLVKHLEFQLAAKELDSSSNSFQRKRNALCILLPKTPSGLEQPSERI